MRATAPLRVLLSPPARSSRTGSVQTDGNSVTGQLSIVFSNRTLLSRLREASNISFPSIAWTSGVPQKARSTSSNASSAEPDIEWRAPRQSSREPRNEETARRSNPGKSADWTPKVLGEGDRRVPAKGRGRTAPYRGRSAASWIWSTPLDASASEGELRSGYALTPSPSHSRNNLSFLQKGGPRKGPSQRTATALFF